MKLIPRLTDSLSCQPEETLPSGAAAPDQQGAVCGPEGVCYRVWAPKARAVDVLVVDGQGGKRRKVALRAADDGFFAGCDKAGMAGDRYFYSLDGGAGLPDPASRWQPEGVHGPSMVVDAAPFPWTDEKWKRHAVRDLVVYELHIGTFTPEGTFRAAIEKLPSLTECGVTAIEIMPIGEFPGGRNWGYDGVYWYAPSRAYGHPDDLRALVDAAHGAGLTVILDVVYNHFGPDGCPLHAFAGEYLNEAEKTPWGGAIRYGDAGFQAMRELLLDNPAYWMREFHIDGFRLDATHAIFDASPRHILQEVTSVIHGRGGFAIAEDPRNDARLITPERQGGFGFDAVWADDFHHSVRVGNTKESEGYLGDFSGEVSETVDILRHGWGYRGQWSAAQNAKRGTEARHLPPEAFVHCISNHDQTGNHAFGERFSHRLLPAARRAADVLICLSPYTPMLFMGQEWAASTPFLFFTDHNEELGRLIVQGRREEFRHFKAFNEPETLEKIPDPQLPRTFLQSKLVWEERERPMHAGALELYKTCLRLRATDAAFRPRGREMWSVDELMMGAGALRYDTIDGCWIVLFSLQGECGGSIPEEAIFEWPSMDWSVVLSSNDCRFGGTGECGMRVREGVALLKAPEAVVLRGKRR